MIGTYALSAGYYEAYYKRAQQVRTLISPRVRRSVREVRCPDDAHIADDSFKIGEKSDDPLAMKLADVCTMPANLAGIPNLDSLRIHRWTSSWSPDSGEGFRCRDAIPHSVHYEQATDWHTRRPPL